MDTVSKFLFLLSISVFFSAALSAQDLQIGIQNNTSCGSPNGLASASVNGETTGYAFEWYAGATINGPLLSFGPTVNHLTGGVYTVKATSHATGYVTLRSAIVLDETAMPVVSVQVLSNHTSCVSANGSLTVVVEGEPTNYDFEWYKEADLTSILSTNQTISQLPFGTYSVKVTDKVSLCQAIVSATVVDQRSIQNVSIQVLSNLTSCVILNGALRAIVPGLSSNYTYQWFEGMIASGTILSTSQSVTNRSTGNYTVLVTHKISKCQVVYSATILDQRINPSASIQVLSPLTSCSAPNGSLKANVSGSSSNYTFKWYKGTTATGTLLSTSQRLNHLSAGAYTVLVTHRTTQCNTAVSATILDQSVILSIQAEANTACMWANGSATVIPSGNPSDYTILWYRGTDATGAVVGTGQTLSMAQEGMYTVLVDHNLSQCAATASVTIADASAAPAASVVVLSNDTSCASPNGSLTVVVEGEPVDYFFQWYQGIDVNSSPAFSTSQTIDHLLSGVYTVKISSKDTGCEVVVSAVVEDHKIIPNVFVQVLSNNTSCGPPRGSLTVLVPGGRLTDYAIAWYEGVDVNSGPVIGITPYLMNLYGGVYTVKVTHIHSGCQSVASQIVLDEIVPMVADIEVVSVQTSCEEPNGALKATVRGGVETDYNFEWYEGVVVGIGPIISLSSTINNLNSFTYSVLITHKISGCQVINSATVPGIICEQLSNSTARATGNPEFTYYPNPVNETLWIESKTVGGEVILMDKDGKVIRKQSISSSNLPLVFQLADQPAGMYILNFASGMHTSTYHIIKE